MATRDEQVKKLQDLSAVVHSALGDDDPISDASAAGDWFEEELLKFDSYASMSAKEARHKAGQLLAAGLALARGYRALCHSLFEAPGIVRTRQAGSGAAVKLARDPKQAAKADAFKLWQEWQTGKARHRSGAAFARHVIDTLPTIESEKTVERWTRQWAKDAKK